MSHILITTFSILKLHWFLACYWDSGQGKENRVFCLQRAAMSCSPCPPQRSILPRSEIAQGKNTRPVVPSCPRWALVCKTGQHEDPREVLISAVCVTRQTLQGKRKPNWRHWCPGWLVPSQEDGTVHSLRDSCFTGWDSCPPRLPTLSKRSKDHVLLCKPPSRTLSISVVQQVARPAGLDSPASVNTRET